MKRDDLVPAIIIVSMIIGAVLYLFSKWMGLPFDLLIRTIGLLVMWLITLAGLIYLGFIKDWWPWMIGLLYACFWPAINHWAIKMPGFSDEVSWWGEWYTKLFVFIILVGCGYAIKAWFSNRNNNHW